VYCFINDVTGFAIGYYFHTDSFLLVAIFNVVEFSLFCLFYYYSISPGMVKKAVFPILGSFFAFACIGFFFNNKMHSFDSIATGVESILIILLCIVYLAVQILRSTNLLVYSTSNFWVIITFLIYVSGSFFINIMAGSMVESETFHVQYDIINSVFYILKNILFSIAMAMKSSPVAKQIPKNDDWEDLLSYKLKN
jgi:hypothetical protein